MYLINERINMNEELIIKYLNREASEEEAEEVFNWIEELPDNKKEFIGLKKVWALTAKGNVDSNNAWLYFLNNKDKQSPKKINLHFLRYAAIFLIILATGSTLYYLLKDYNSANLVYEKNTTISVPYGQMANVELPDGTRVMLNSGTTLTYKGSFSDGQRFVSLKGEAFFDVSKDIEHPFIVNTQFLDFKVYGTSFNIEAYPEEQMVNATLVTGSLGIFDQKNIELYKLTPNQKASFNTLNSKIAVKKVDTELYTAWTEGIVTFRNEKLKDIARKIERWYNVKIIISNPNLGEEGYFGTIMKNKPVDQILEVLKLTCSLKYKIETKRNEPSIIYWY